VKELDRMANETMRATANAEGIVNHFTLAVIDLCCAHSIASRAVDGAADGHVQHDVDELDERDGEHERVGLECCWWQCRHEVCVEESGGRAVCVLIYAVRSALLTFDDDEEDDGSDNSTQRQAERWLDDELMNDAPLGLNQQRGE
jgi:hypothetical protein